MAACDLEREEAQLKAGDIVLPAQFASEVLRAAERKPSDTEHLAIRHLREQVEAFDESQQEEDDDED